MRATWEGLKLKVRERGGSVNIVIDFKGVGKLAKNSLPPCKKKRPIFGGKSPIFIGINNLYRFGLVLDTIN